MNQGKIPEFRGLAALVKALIVAAESEKSNMVVLFLCAAMFMVGWFCDIPTEQIVAAIVTMVFVSLVFPFVSAYFSARREEMRLREIQAKLFGSSVSASRGKTSPVKSSRRNASKRRGRKK